MMSWSSTSEITGKWGHLGWILVKTRRRKQEENIGLLGNFSGNWQPDLFRNIGLEPKVGKVFGENVSKKLMMTQNPMKPYKMGLERRSFAQPEAHQKLPDRRWI